MLRNGMCQTSEIFSLRFHCAAKERSDKVQNYRSDKHSKWIEPQKKLSSCGNEGTYL